MANTNKTAKVTRVIAEIARRELRIETLTEQRSDSLDFHTRGVLEIEAALRAAFEAGHRQARFDASKGKS